MGHWFSSFLTCTVGHRVGEVAHDYVPTLKQWLSAEEIRKSYDSWHGMLLPVHRNTITSTQHKLGHPLWIYAIMMYFPFCRWKGGEKSYQKGC